MQQPRATTPIITTPPARRGFTMAELLVVILIIAILVSITIPVVSKMREAAWKTDSLAQLNSIRGAIEAYHQTFSAYPGPVSDKDVGQDASSIGIANLKGDKFTGSENLVLGLVGGLSVQGSGVSFEYDDTTKQGIDVGKGPRKLSGNAKAHSPFYTETKHLSKGAGDGRMEDVATQGAIYNDSNVPEFLDRFPNDPRPVLYLRARRGQQPDTISTDGVNSHYNLAHITPYTAGTGSKHGLKDLGTVNSPYITAGRYFTNGSLSNATTLVPRAKDTYIIISAGADRLYGTEDDLTSFGSFD